MIEKRDGIIARIARCALVLLALPLLLATVPGRSAAQPAPNLRWYTFTTAHFHVHFSDGMEPTARLAAHYAEQAYAGLASEIKAPRGMIELVMADNRDVANAYATVFPTNRIVVYTVPPVDVATLRNYDSWLRLVVAHELVHVFHLDRAEGLWRAAQYIFGRNPSMMPNLYSPAWLREGLAVYYESRLTGSGRMYGSEHAMIVRGAAEDSVLPGLGDMSIVTSTFPEAQTPYVFGAQLVKALAERGGAAEIDAFLGSMSAKIIPYLYSESARSAFGVRFGQVWSEFRDSASTLFGQRSQPAAGWRELGAPGRIASNPRWLADGTLIFSGSNGRESAGLYQLSPDGAVRRIARRNGTGVNVPVAGGSVVFVQPEYIDAYTIRSDLYRMDADGTEHRLTRGARLISPDVRADGSVVAVQISGAATSIVRVAADGSQIDVVAGGNVLEHWADPRWSPDGNSLVAVRRDPVQGSSIVLLNLDGGQRPLTTSAGLKSSPVWVAPDQVLFVEDVAGRSQLSVVGTNAGSPSQVATRSSTGVFTPAVAAGRPYLAATEYRGDGYHLGVLATPPQPAAATPLTDIGLLRQGGAAPLVAAAAGASDAIPAEIQNAPVRSYSALRQLWPRYWVPLASAEADGNGLIGGSTSGFDVLERHSYRARALFNTGTGAMEGSFSYQYAGLGNPLLNLTLLQSGTYSAVFGGQPRSRVGYLRERSQLAALSVQLRRPRYRNSASLSLGAEYEKISYSTDPETLLPSITNFDATPREYVAAAGGISFSNVQRPALSISPEDGVALSGTVRSRWSSRYTFPPWISLSGSLRAFKSIDLPGFAHHVVALRLSGASSNKYATSRYSVGGKSGSKLEVFPGYTIGDVSRQFPVRGFDPGTLVGLHAFTASLEYRLPLFMPSSGFGMLPVFVDRVSLSLFGDAGTAWCPVDYLDELICRNLPSEYTKEWIGSVGAELNLDSALQYDLPYRFRVGVAHRVRTPEELSRSTEVYFTLGIPF